MPKPAAAGKLKLPYAQTDLRRVGKMRSFTGAQLDQIAFPLGGIGTGTVSLGGRGNLRDWEIHNRPGKNKFLPITFFAGWFKEDGTEPVARVLERRVLPPYHNGHGYDRSALQGVARLEEATFRGEYPFAWIDFRDRQVPVKVALEAYTPFVPLDADASSYPAAIFNWTFTNPGKKSVEVSLLASMHNPIGRQDIGVKSEIKSLLNQYRTDNNIHGIWFTAPELPQNDPNQMTAALSTPWRQADVQTNLYKGGWWDSAHILWDDFAADGHLEPNIVSEFSSNSTDGKGAPPTMHFFDLAQHKGGYWAGVLCLRAKVKPGETVTLPVTIAWHSPFLKSWTDNIICRTYVANQFRDAWDAASRLQQNLNALEAPTRKFHADFYSSTLPEVALDAAGSQASIIRTNTCIRLADGQFYGWEGCSDDVGCCHGTCTHVWNYEQALAFLFPQLERSIRRNEFLNSTDPRGKMDFRTSMPANSRTWNHPACGDGQMGCIIRLYRDWQVSGDEAFLRESWPGAQRALEYAWTEPGGWDADKDGVMEGVQHNTYDIEFYGPNPLMSVMYLGALEAGARIADHLGDSKLAREYRQIAANGRKRIEKKLFNGAYYIQKVEVGAHVEVPGHLQGPLESAAEGCGTACDCNQPPGGKTPARVPGKDFEVKYQHAGGCLSDQLLGQWASHVAGLGHVLDSEQVATALESIYRHNFCAEIGSFSNVQRIYALNDEAGLLLCSWPDGDRARLPFPYCDEVWTGIEYQVAAHLIYEDRVDLGLALAKAVRERYDGLRRNPWNEVECGHHYARAMASWSLLTALTGFSYSLPEGRLGFAPKLNAEKFRGFFSVGSGWGTYAQRAAARKFQANVDISFGEVVLRRLNVVPGFAPKTVQAALSGKAVPAELEREGAHAAVCFPDGMRVPAGAKLELTLS